MSVILDPTRIDFYTAENLDYLVALMAKVGPNKTTIIADQDFLDFANLLAMNQFGCVPYMEGHMEQRLQLGSFKLNEYSQNPNTEASVRSIVDSLQVLYAGYLQPYNLVYHPNGVEFFNGQNLTTLMAKVSMKANIITGWRIIKLTMLYRELRRNGLKLTQQYIQYLMNQTVDTTPYINDIAIPFTKLCVDFRKYEIDYGLKSNLAVICIKSVI